MVDVVSHVCFRIPTMSLTEWYRMFLICRDKNMLFENIVYYVPAACLHDCYGNWITDEILPLIWGIGSHAKTVMRQCLLVHKFTNLWRHKIFCYFDTARLILDLSNEENYGKINLWHYLMGCTSWNKNSISSTLSNSPSFDSFLFPQLLSNSSIHVEKL